MRLPLGAVRLELCCARLLDDAAVFSVRGDKEGAEVAWELALRAGDGLGHVLPAGDDAALTILATDAWAGLGDDFDFWVIAERGDALRTAPGAGTATACVPARAELLATDWAGPDVELRGKPRLPPGGLCCCCLEGALLGCFCVARALLLCSTSFEPPALLAQKQARDVVDERLAAGPRLH